MTRRAYLVSEKRVVCFWSPKAGNSSLGNWLVQGLWAEEHESSGLHFRQFLTETGRVAHFRRASKAVLRQGFDSFALVRNPYSRAVSAYGNKFVYNGDVALDRFDLLEAFAQGFAVNGVGAKSDDGYSGISFTEFLEAVVVRVRCPKENGEPGLNSHWNTQVPFEVRSTGFGYGQIIRLENIATEVAPLGDRLGIAAPFPHRRSRREANTGLDLSEASSLEIIRDGLIPGDNNLLTPRTRALIEEAYAIDFDLLGYETIRS